MEITRRTTRTVVELAWPEAEAPKLARKVWFSSTQDNRECFLRRVEVEVSASLLMDVDSYYQHVSFVGLVQPATGKGKVSAKPTERITLNRQDLGPEVHADIVATLQTLAKIEQARLGRVN